MKDIGPLTYMVSLRFDMTPNHTTVSQDLYAQDILTRFNHLDAHPSKIPLPEGTILYAAGDKETRTDLKRHQSVVGSLMYLMLGSHPFLAFAISQLTRHP